MSKNHMILKPDPTIPWPHQNIFPGENITPDIGSAFDPKSVSVLPIDYLIAGTRFIPTLVVNPPTAHGFKVAWYFDNKRVYPAADGAFVLPNDTKAHDGFYAEITLLTGERFVTPATPRASMIPLTIALVGGTVPVLTFGKTSSPLQFSIGPFFNYKPPIPGMVITVTPVDSSQVRVNSDFSLTPLQDKAQNIKLDMEVEFRGVKYKAPTGITIQQVVSRPLVSFVINEADKAEMRVGEAVNLTLTLNPTDTSDTTFSWKVLPEGAGVISFPSSINTRSATLTVKQAIDTGLSVVVTSTRAGVASKTFKVVKTRPAVVSVTGVTLDKTQGQNLRVGDKVTLTATVLPANADNQSVQWTASDNGVIKLTYGPDGPFGKVAIAEMLKAGSGASVTVRTASESKTAVFTTGQINPKPVMPADINLMSALLDSRITYNGGEVAFIAADGSMGWSPVDIWPLQYISGAIVGRTLPEPVTPPNQIKANRQHFEGANQTNAQGSDNWRYGSSSSPQFPGTAGIDGLAALSAINWQNQFMAIQDGSTLRAQTNTMDKQITISPDWTRYGIRVSIPGPAEIETGFIIAKYVSNDAQTTLYSYKATAAETVMMSAFRKGISGRWIYSIPTIQSGASMFSPPKPGADSLLPASLLVAITPEVARVRVTFSDSTTRDFLPITGATSVSLMAADTDDWFTKIATKISFLAE